MEHSDEPFYICLMSNASLHTFPDNTLSEFTNELARQCKVDETCVCVGLTEISYNPIPAPSAVPPPASQSKSANLSLSKAWRKPRRKINEFLESDDDDDDEENVNVLSGTESVENRPFGSMSSSSSSSATTLAVPQPSSMIEVFDMVADTNTHGLSSDVSIKSNRAHKKKRMSNEPGSQKFTYALNERSKRQRKDTGSVIVTRSVATTQTAQHLTVKINDEYAIILTYNDLRSKTYAGRDLNCGPLLKLLPAKLVGIGLTHTPTDDELNAVRRNVKHGIFRKIAETHWTQRPLLTFRDNTADKNFRVHIYMGTPKASIIILPHAKTFDNAEQFVAFIIDQIPQHLRRKSDLLRLFNIFHHEYRISNYRVTTVGDSVDEEVELSDYTDDYDIDNEAFDNNDGTMNSTLLSKNSTSPALVKIFFDEYGVNSNVNLQSFYASNVATNVPQTPISLEDLVRKFREGLVFKNADQLSDDDKKNTRLQIGNAVLDVLRGTNFNAPQLFKKRTSHTIDMNLPYARDPNTGGYQLFTVVIEPREYRRIDDFITEIFNQLPPSKRYQQLFLQTLDKIFRDTEALTEKSAGAAYHDSYTENVGTVTGIMAAANKVNSAALTAAPPTQQQQGTATSPPPPPPPPSTSPDPATQQQQPASGTQQPGSVAAPAATAGVQLSPMDAALAQAMAQAHHVVGGPLGAALNTAHAISSAINNDPRTLHRATMSVTPAPLTNFLYIYTDIVKERYLADSMGRFLRIINIADDRQLSLRTHQFTHVEYVPLEHLQFESISILLADSQGNRIRFDSSKTPTYVMLHFRKMRRDSYASFW